MNQTDPTELSGQIERITYTNLENGFTIAKVKVPGKQDLVTVSGNMIAPRPGEILKMKGRWTRHPQYGEQFQVTDFQTTVPATVYGIRKYLGSGLIRGIGPVMAGRIVNRFGEKTLDIIEDQIDQLAAVEGIGKKRIEMVRIAWHAQKEIRQVMVFLQTYEVSPGYAAKIFKQYQNRAIEVVRENPYRLAMDIPGIGFITADRIADRLGFEKDSPLRVEAGILYVLHQLADEGHVYYPCESLLEKCRDILQVEKDAVMAALGSIHLAQKIVIEDLKEGTENLRPNHKAVFLTRFHASETGIAVRLKRLGYTAKSIRKIDANKAVEWVQRQLSITLAPKQIEAVGCALDHKVLVITGGPGTGKTTIINGILKIFSSLKARILLTAPTGRAAKRMAETTGHGAKTIHRLLEYSLQQGGFQRNDKKPLNCDLMIIDEVSMVDTILMHHLLKAIPLRATLVLVGDVNQLPSVGAGNVLKDIIASGRLPVVELKEIFRQAKQSRIVTNAHLINNGIIPSVKPSGDSGSKNDFYFIHQEDPEKALKIIIELVKERIPGRFGFDPVNDIQVLTPMHKGIIGAENLNAALQQSLNPGEDKLIRGSRKFRVNDKVMQIKNNYEKDVFNGDMGRIIWIHPQDQELMISFDGRKKLYNFSDLDEIVLSYAISVHKSQGSEYPAVVIPLLTQHYLLLQRNLIYTAITRGKNLVVMVGTVKALAISVKNDKTTRRYTHLQHRL
ncbi:MAG: ATP-dependent RecD-like DNA helicase [Desulfobacterales bacterium]|nr:ATP-dependent RecD-like DNA helicase [Desulfobacterales bacterium]